MTMVQRPMDKWKHIPWKKIEREVFKLQKRIYQASQEGRVQAVHKLQRLLMASRGAKLLATRRVTQDNAGKKTAGVDGVKALNPNQRMKLSKTLRIGGKASPLRRVWIPKPGTEEKRPLGIPTLQNRAVQALGKLAMEPEWEAKFEGNSYGFRIGRSCHDAIAAIFTSISRDPKAVLDADITKCFDRINHEELLKKLGTYPALRRQIKAWLRAGILDGETLFPTVEGTPQGGVISPLLANIALHGLETEIIEHFRRKGCKRLPTIIRYADGMPEQTLNERVKVPSPQLLIQGSSSGAAYAGDCVGEVPPHRPPKVAAEEQAAAKANPQLSLVIRKSGGRPTRRKGKAETAREEMSKGTAQAPPGCQERHVPKVQRSKSGRSVHATGGVAAEASVYKAESRSDEGACAEVGGACSTRTGEDSKTSAMMKLVGGPRPRDGEKALSGKGALLLSVPSKQIRSSDCR